MPNVTVVFYCDEEGEAPFLEWFDELPDKAQDKCLAKLERLAEMGHELRRPEADYLKDDIYELRFEYLSVNYRVLYYFHGRQLIVLSHGFKKQQSKVPEKEISIAVSRRQKFIKNPERHTYEE